MSLGPGTLEFSVIFVVTSINGLQSSATSSKLEALKPQTTFVGKIANMFLNVLGYVVF